MHLHFVFIGKTAFADIDSAIQRYLDRLRHYTPLAIHFLKAEKITKSVSEEAVRERESDRALDLADKDGALIVWDQRGKQLTSPELAAFFERFQIQGQANVWMVIGGPVGVSPKLRERASAVLSLSRMTLPHDLARLVVMEQVYRAFTILKGEPYHK
jgi:23S rRNA (pseudouridine1915-N3)-methyltransferase